MATVKHQQIRVLVLTCVGLTLTASGCAPKGSTPRVEEWHRRAIEAHFLVSSTVSHFEGAKNFVDFGRATDAICSPGAVTERLMPARAALAALATGAQSLSSSESLRTGVRDVELELNKLEKQLEETWNATGEAGVANKCDDAAAILDRRQEIEARFLILLLESS